MNKIIKNKDTLIDKAVKYILPVLLGAAVAYDVIECYYSERAWIFTFLFLVAEALLFIVFDWLKSKRYIGALIYTAGFAALIFFSGLMLRNGSLNSRIYFVDWFYLDRNNAGFVLEYFYALFAGGGFFLISYNILFYSGKIQKSWFYALRTFSFCYSRKARRAYERPSGRSAYYSFSCGNGPQPTAFGQGKKYKGCNEPFLHYFNSSVCFILRCGGNGYPEA